MKNGLVIDERGNKYWYKDDEFHREDGPASESADGTKYWYLNGRRHREDGPAVEFPDGTKRWWYKDIFVGQGDKPDPVLWTRLTSVELNGGPLLNGCVVDLDGKKHWYRDDKLHREDGPAVEWWHGEEQWYFNGRHLGYDAEGFWNLWALLTDEQRGNPTLLKYLPR